MRLIFQIILIVAVAFLLELFLPWWSIAIAALVGGALLPSRYNFLAGFVAIAVLWLVKALIMDVLAATELTEKVAQIFKLPGKTVLYIVMMLIGGLVGGFASMAGGALKK